MYFQKRFYEKCCNERGRLTETHQFSTVDEFKNDLAKLVIEYGYRLPDGHSITLHDRSKADDPWDVSHKAVVEIHSHAELLVFIA